MNIKTWGRYVSITTFIINKCCEPPRRWSRPCHHSVCKLTLMLGLWLRLRQRRRPSCRSCVSPEMTTTERCRETTSCSLECLSPLRLWRTLEQLLVFGAFYLAWTFAGSQREVGISPGVCLSEIPSLRYCQRLYSNLDESLVSEEDLRRLINRDRSLSVIYCFTFVYTR